MLCLCLDFQVVVLDALSEPVPRLVFDYVVRIPHVEKFFELLENRCRIRAMCRTGHRPVYGDTEENLAHILRKLTNLGMTSADEDKLMASL